jgi:hypothetical protein
MYEAVRISGPSAHEGDKVVNPKARPHLSLEVISESITGS